MLIPPYDYLLPALLGADFFVPTQGGRMPNFTRLADRIINLSQIREIRFPNNTVEIYWQNGESITLDHVNAALLLQELEKNYSLMTAVAARLWEDS